ncbi:MAG: hypothetical protein LBG52_07770 [Candidatus Peribacteria bacterium]|jgi:hypothetical protein|nr:hypothetical protein [Candidatus Peribacteria bacterium]
MHVDEHGEFVFTDHEDVKDNIDEIGKKNAETKQFLEKATWTNNKGVKEILFEPCTLGLAFAIEDTSFFVAGNVNKR